jgi:Tfp pilus assembly protein PilO
MAFKGDLRRNLIRAVLICAAADVALIGFFLSPWMPSRDAAEVRVAESQAAVMKLERRVQSLNMLVVHLTRSRREMRQFVGDAMPPEQIASSAVLADVTQLADRANVSASDLRFVSEKKPHAGLRRIGVAVKLRGSYPQLIEFLNELERAKTFYIIDQVAISSSEQQTGGTQIALAVHFETYAQALPDSAGADPMEAGGPQT